MYLFGVLLIICGKKWACEICVVRAKIKCCRYHTKIIWDEMKIVS